MSTDKEAMAQKAARRLYHFPLIGIPVGAHVLLQEEYFDSLIGWHGITCQGERNPVPWYQDKRHIEFEGLVIHPVDFAYSEDTPFAQAFGEPYFAFRDLMTEKEHYRILAEKEEARKVACEKLMRL